MIIFVGCFYSCNDEDEVGNEMERRLVGKWEPFAIKSYDTNGILVDQEVTPYGYREYFSDGRFAWYDYTTEIYTFAGEFRIEYLSSDSSMWVLHHDYNENFLKENPSGLYIPNKVYIPIREWLRMPDYNTISLNNYDLITIAAQSTPIYKRKK
jgi:hypothetical protein